MKIQMLRFYQNTRGVTLKPEIYEATHPDLAGMANYLIENGYATIITDGTLPDDSELGQAPSLADLRTRYTELAGKKAYAGWDESTLMTKIADLEDNA